MWPIAKNGRIQFQSRKFWISLSKNCIVHWSDAKRKIRLLRNLFSSSAVCGELFLEVPYSTKTAILKHSFVLSWLLQGTMCAHLHKSSVAFELENENGHCESLDTVLWRVRAKALKRGSESFFSCWKIWKSYTGLVWPRELVKISTYPFTLPVTELHCQSRQAKKLEILMPCPFTGPKFCARPKLNWHIVAVTNILCQKKTWFQFRH